MVMRDPDTGRYVRALPGPDELAAMGDPRERPANSNPPLPTVGPSPASDSPGNSFGMYPEGFPAPEAWAGWPVKWATQWSNLGANAAQWTSRSDIVFSCLDRNTGPLATMPPYIERGGENLGESARSWLSNPEPLAYNSWPEFMRQMTWLYWAAGEVFLVCTARYADGYPQRFVVVEPWLVDVDRTNGRKSYQINQTPVPAEDVLHIKYLGSPSGLRGIGPLESGGFRLEVAEALTRYAADLAANGGAPWAVLKAARTLTAEQAQRLQAQWIQGRLRAGGAPAVLDAETDIEVLSGNPKDMMLDELAKFAESRIAVLLGVPPHLVGLPSGGDSLTYSTVTMMYDAHWRGTLRVHSKKISADMDGWLLPNGTHLQFDNDAYTQPPPLERAQTYEILLRAGVVTVDEVRTREHFGPLNLPTNAPIVQPVEVSQ